MRLETGISTNVDERFKLTLSEDELKLILAALDSHHSYLADSILELSERNNHCNVSGYLSDFDNTKKIRDNLKKHYAFLVSFVESSR